MSKSKKELVRDGFFGDLPEEIQLKIMNIHKLICSTCEEVWKDKAYNPIREEDWARTAIEEFCTQPADNNLVGSVRVYQKGKRNTCMIQITGHVINHRNDINHELLHDFFRHVHYDMKQKVRKQFDMRLTCESEHGEPFEGFDVWPSSKVAKVIWNLFEDKKTKNIKEMKESTDTYHTEKIFAEMYELPNGLQEFIENLNGDIVESMMDHLCEDKYEKMFEHSDLVEEMLIESYIGTSDSGEIGDTVLYKYEDGTYGGSITLTTECIHPRAKNFYNHILKECQIIDDSTKVLCINESGNRRSFDIFLDPQYAAKLWNYLENTDPEVFTEKKTQEEYAREHFKKKYKYDPKDSTIEVDGKRIKVNMDKNNKNRMSTAFYDKNENSNYINLPSDFFKLKNPKRRDAVLMHEIGHLKMHNPYGNNISDKRRQDDIDAIEKYTKSTGPYKNNHLNNIEFEADRYSANKVGETQLKRAMRETKKQAVKRRKSDIYKDIPDNILKQIEIDAMHEVDPFSDTCIQDQNKMIDKKVQEYRKSGKYVNKFHKINEIDQDEYKQRSKALNDTTLRNSPTYRESFEDDIIFDPMMEANNPTPEYNTDMTEAEAKKTLRTVSQNMINDMENKKDYKVSQYTANIYANIISKNLLPLWANGFRKFSITLDSYQSFPTFEFKVPKMTQDFVSRFIRGRESINGFIHRSPEINVKMSPKIFHSMKNPDDAFNFFRSAIKYYNNGLEKYSDKLMVETMKLNHELKHLISTTKLSGIVTCPMQLLFVFDDVDMTNKDTFKISQQDIKTVNQFIRNIYTRYAAPEKEKKQIVDDLNEMIKALKESCDTSDENIRQLTYLPEAVNDYLFGKFEKTTTECNEQWMTEQFDMEWIRNQKNPQVKYLQEKFGVKKLKKIPSDLVAYITIETEAIRDANDKMMISSYCLSKIEIVEWYIELLEVGSKKYIVPHTKPYLESVRTQLLACFDRIMKVKIVNPNDRPLIDIRYPKNYEG